jgi:transposase
MRAVWEQGRKRGSYTITSRLLDARAQRGSRPDADEAHLIESSTESEWVARSLEGLGHEVVVADPNFAPMYATRSRRVKTDKRDARTLAEACKLGAYKPAHRTSEVSRMGGRARIIFVGRRCDGRRIDGAPTLRIPEGAGGTDRHL